MTPRFHHERPATVVYLIGSLGDTIIAIPALRAIREHWPDRSLLLLYNSDHNGRVTARDVLEDSGLVDEYLPYDATRGPREKVRVLRALRNRRVDTAIYLAPSLRPDPAMVRDRWFFRLAGASRLIGFVPASGWPTHEAESRLERLNSSGIPISANACALPLMRPSAAAVQSVSAWLDVRRSAGRRPLVAFSPGSQMPAKHWPVERFAELGHRLLAAYSVDAVIVGGPAERAIGDYLTSAWGSGINAAGRFTVPETAALLAKSDLLVTLDTGPMHVAAAVGTPCIALFSGIEREGKWDPIGEHHIVIRKNVPCTPCRLSVCPLDDHPCMTQITVDDAWRAILTKCGEWKGASLAQVARK